jgi:hypothetical protein
MIHTNFITSALVATLCLATGCSATSDRNATQEPEATPAATPSAATTSLATARYVTTQKSDVPLLEIIVADQPIDCDSPPPAGATYLTVAIPGVAVPPGTYPATSGVRAISAGSGAVSEVDSASGGTITLTESFSSADPLSATAAVVGQLELVFQGDTSSRTFAAKGCPARRTIVP